MLACHLYGLSAVWGDVSECDGWRHERKGGTDGGE
jgi:hypothetical protein